MAGRVPRPRGVSWPRNLHRIENSIRNYRGSPEDGDLLGNTLVNKSDSFNENIESNRLGIPLA